MKHKAIIYAKALADVDEKKCNAGDLFRLLQKNGDTKKLREIIVLTEKILLAKHGNKKVIVETARQSAKHDLKSFIKTGDIVEEKVNPSLIAGVKITVNGECQLDVSLAQILENIFQ